MLMMRAFANIGALQTLFIHRGLLLKALPAASLVLAAVALAW